MRILPVGSEEEKRGSGTRGESDPDSRFLQCVFRVAVVMAEPQEVSRFIEEPIKTSTAEDVTGVKGICSWIHGKPGNLSL